MIDLYDIHYKLEYANWLEWESSEVEAIKKYILADWTDFVNNQIRESSELRLDDYLKFFSIEILMDLWEIDNVDSALINFVTFFYYNGTAILNDQFKINGTKSNQALIDLIYRDQLIEKLEALFFKVEPKDEAFAEKISIVLQMIEQERRTP